MNADMASGTLRRSYRRAGLYGALVPMVLGTALLMSWVLANPYRDTHRAMPLAEAFLGFFAFLPQAGFVGFPAAYALTGFMALIEARKPKPLLLWLLVSLVVTTPFAAIAWVVGHMGDCFQNCRTLSEWQLSAPALLIYTCGLLGAVVARRVRHGVWR